MENRGNENLAYFEALRARGWHLEDNCLYSPRIGIRIEGNAHLPRHMVETVYAKQKEILEKMRQSRFRDSEKELNENAIRDLESVVDALKDLLDS